MEGSSPVASGTALSTILQIFNQVSDEKIILTVTLL